MMSSLKASSLLLFLVSYVILYLALVFINNYEQTETKKKKEYHYLRIYHFRTLQYKWDPLFEQCLFEYFATCVGEATFCAVCI